MTFKAKQLLYLQKLINVAEREVKNECSIEELELNEEIELKLEEMKKEGENTLYI